MFKQFSSDAVEYVYSLGTPLQKKEMAFTYFGTLFALELEKDSIASIIKEKP